QQLNFGGSSLEQIYIQGEITQSNIALCLNLLKIAPKWQIGIASLDQVKQQIRGLKTLRELTRTFEKFVAPSFPGDDQIVGLSMFTYFPYPLPRVNYMNISFSFHFDGDAKNR
ncbi:hypothetical protein ACJX0J_033187, partial [Zea mays]